MKRQRNELRLHRTVNNSVEPMQCYLADIVGSGLLPKLELIIDDAGGRSAKFREEVTSINSVYNNNSSRRSRSSTASKSYKLPPASRSSGVSRWDSCQNQTTVSLSPPMRKPRRVSDKICTDSPMPPKRFYKGKTQTSPSQDHPPTPKRSLKQLPKTLPFEPLDTDSPKSSSSEPEMITATQSIIYACPETAMKDIARARKCLQSPSVPIRQASFKGLPSCPPCWLDEDEREDSEMAHQDNDDLSSIAEYDDDSSSSSSASRASHGSDSPSPTSVRIGLDEILGQALQECANFHNDDDYSASAMANLKIAPK